MLAFLYDRIIIFRLTWRRLLRQQGSQLESILRGQFEVSTTGKVFISWAGDRSHQVAQALYRFLKGALQGVEPILSSESIRSGDCWSQELEDYLTESVFGIVCLTQENPRSPWLCYEAGALSKSLTTKVCPYLVDGELDATHPLSRFNYRCSNRDDTLALLTDINNQLPDGTRTTPEVLANAFKGVWPDFERLLAEIKLDSCGISRVQGAARRIADAAQHLDCRPDLFTGIVSWSLERIVEQGNRWSKGSMDLRDTEVMGKGIEVFKRLRRSGFATLLVKLDHFWATSDEYFQTCRQRANELGDGRIQRVFILDSHEVLFNDSLREHIRLDALSGIDVRVCFSSDLPTVACRDFGIWDDELLCLMLVSRQLLLEGCTFTREEDRLSFARKWRDEILAKAEPAQPLLDRFDASSSDGDGFLARTASVMVEHADRYCQPRRSYVDRSESCRWYHSAWQYLRLLRLVSTPDWHADFYRRALSDAFANGAKRVLISGTADYAMLDHVVRAIPESRRQTVQISVLDLCATPVHMCELYERQFMQPAGYRGLQCLRGVDILQNNQTESSFDIVVTDAFLTRFPPVQQAAVVTAWHRLLSVGGTVITTIRLSTGGDGSTRATPEQRKKFVDRIRSLIHEENGSFGVLRPKENEIISLADTYAARMRSQQVGQEANIIDLFEPLFKVSVETETMRGEFQLETKYARVIAVAVQSKVPESRLL